MASESLGSFGTYKCNYTRQFKEFNNANTYYSGATPKQQQDVPITWVTQRYIPTDLRVTAPVPRYKIVRSQLPPLDQSWKLATDPPLRKFERQDDKIYSSHPSTRSQEWSTLRQTLPSRGIMFKPNPPNWGTGHSQTSISMDLKPKRFPKVNSPMTRYVDDMHLTNRLFKLH